MTNTDINVAGHKITTNKVGAAHSFTTLETGFTVQGAGSVSWVVTNGICTISISSIRASSTGNNQKVLDNVPKSKIFCAGADRWNDLFYVIAGGTALRVDVVASSTTNLYTSFAYPVADDWVES